MKKTHRLGPMVAESNPNPERVSTLHTNHRLRLAIAGLLSISLITASASALKLNATKFQATDSRRVLDIPVQTNSPTVTRKEYVRSNNLKPAIAVSPMPVVIKPRPAKRAARTRTAPSYVSGTPKQVGYKLMLGYWPSSEWTYLEKLWEKESDWDPNAVNPSSGACKIPQALPCSKIKDGSLRGQILWGLRYIKSRYGSPAAAWRHSQRTGWY